MTVTTMSSSPPKRCGKAEAEVGKGTKRLPSWKRAVARYRMVQCDEALVGTTVTTVAYRTVICDAAATPNAVSTEKTNRIAHYRGVPAQRVT
jgi:hypothetical protein